ncbi:MAG: S41 family peptidase [Terriglobia bacterium]
MNRNSVQRLIRLAAAIALGVLVAIGCLGAPNPPLLLQTPAVSKTQIAFAYGGDIWIVSRAGGRAHRLVTGADTLQQPVFSPDGTMLAYTGNYQGNDDVYVVPASGGEPLRLTYHPGLDGAVGWTPDGKSVLFASGRSSYSDPHQLFTVPATGGFPTELPLPMAETGSYSPDGTHLAYVPNFRWEPFWQGYRGGQTTPVWIANLSDSSVVKIPRDNSNDDDPMWIGHTVYFLSDRNGPITLFAYDTQSRKVTQVLKNTGFDITYASAGPDAIVYSQFGQIHLYDLKSRRSKLIPIEAIADMPQLQPRFENVGTHIVHSDISPTGARAVFEAHGDILTVPVKKGDIRDITNSPAVEDRDPAWSPDGKWIAYFSDGTGEYDLRIREQSGLGPVRTIHLAQPSAYYYQLRWSPDGKTVSFSDQAMNLWYLDLDHPAPVKIDTDLFGTPLHEFDEAWSPDSKWLAYTKELPNHLRAVFVYSLADHKATQITDGMSDCLYPNFDRGGKYIYFTASTDMGLTAGWLDMSSEAHPVTRSGYVVVLARNVKSPLLPESDEEKAEASKPPAGAAAKNKPPKPTVTVSIDFDGILNRTLALPVPPANYVGMSAGKTGELFLVEAPIVEVRREPPGPPPLSVIKFDLKARKTQTIVSGISSFDLSFNGDKMLYKLGPHWFITSSKAAAKAGDGLLKTDQMQVYVVPREEWNQMYHEVWRIERAFFYDPHLHGLNADAAEKEFAAYLPGIESRDDLNFLFEEMLSYISVGHMFIRGGVEPQVPHVTVGLLGADYTIENNRYRFATIYSGENWNPDLHAPLTQPGVNVQPGEYLLAVNGRELHGTDNIYSFFENTAGKQVSLEVGPYPDGRGSRHVIVIPVPNDHALRNLDWIEANRRRVDKLSGGKLAYVYLPDTAVGGFTNFNRYFFSQVDKEGAIIDERFNHGGQLSDYIIDYLRRKPMAITEGRYGKTYLEPPEAIFGPKVMIINQFSGSGGDALPWYFHRTAIGPLVGVRTWGGLVGIGGYPPLMDGGSVTAPRWAIGGLNGHWQVENHGIPPDVEVWQDPALVRQGHDPQLERAVAVAMELLAKNPPPHYAPPPYPNHHPHPPPLPAQE